MSSLLDTRPTVRRAPGAHRPASDSFLGLGLAARTDERGEIDRLFGLRQGRMVEIRLTPAEFQCSPDDCESTVWLLTSTPLFDCVLHERSAMPAFVSDAIGDVPLFVPIWQGVRISGGPLGLVAVRSAGSPLSQAFQHDLWLLERIAAKLGTLPLPAGDLAREPLPVGGAHPAGRSTAAGRTTRNCMALAG